MASLTWLAAGQNWSFGGVDIACWMMVTWVWFHEGEWEQCLFQRFQCYSCICGMWWNYKVCPVEDWKFFLSPRFSFAWIFYWFRLRGLSSVKPVDTRIGEKHPARGYYLRPLLTFHLLIRCRCTEIVCNVSLSWCNAFVGDGTKLKANQFFCLLYFCNKSKRIGHN